MVVGLKFHIQVMCEVAVHVGKNGKLLLGIVLVIRQSIEHTQIVMRQVILRVQIFQGFQDFDGFGVVILVRVLILVLNINLRQRHLHTLIKRAVIHAHLVGVNDTLDVVFFHIDADKAHIGIVLVFGSVQGILVSLDCFIIRRLVLVVNRTKSEIPAIIVRELVDNFVCIGNPIFPVARIRISVRQTCHGLDFDFLPHILLGVADVLDGRLIVADGAGVLLQFPQHICGKKAVKRVLLV